MAPTPDKPDVSAETPKTAKPTDTVTLAVGHPYDEWNHGVDGVDPITADGTEVPAGKETEIRDAARSADVTLRKVR